MSMISDLVERLRTEAKSMGTYGTDYMATLLTRSADTIEMLSEKAREPKRGEWIDMWDKYCFEGTFKCSVCGTPWTLIDGTPQDNGMNFCPNCGADMRGKDDEASD